MKFCEECGAKLDDAALFCDECGAKIEETVIVKDGNKKSTKKTNFYVIIIAVLLLIIVAMIIVFVVRGKSNNADKATNTTIEDLTQETLTTEEVTTEEITTEETTTEEVTTEEQTTEEATLSSEHQALVDRVNGDYKELSDYLGTWYDIYSGRCFMEIKEENEGIIIKIKWSSGWRNSAEWHLKGVYDAKKGCIAYVAGKQVYTTSYDAGYIQEDVLYTDGSGVFFYNDGYIRWFDKKENAGEYCMFERYDFEW